MASETGEVTGTKDKDYNLIWFTEQSLSNALRLENYIQDAERAGDDDLAGFFRRAQEASRKGGELGKELLKKRLAGGWPSPFPPGAKWRPARIPAPTAATPSTSGRCRACRRARSAPTRSGRRSAAATPRLI